jgi:AraC family transcriptional regulator
MPIELSEVNLDLTIPDSADQPYVRPECSLPGMGRRSSTSTSRYEAVERAIMAMRRRWDEPLTLQVMADIALLSRFHFNRVFRIVTGVPPRKFLSALRIEAAKRLLVTTQFTVSDVCFGVGYNSLGSFSRDFTRFVGLSPRNLRRLAEGATALSLQGLPAHDPHQCHDTPPGTGFAGRVFAPDEFVGHIFMGLFTTAIPQGRPVSCTLLDSPGSYRIANVPNGTYHLFAAAFPQSEDPLVYLLPDWTNVYVGASHDQLHVSEGTVNGDADLALRKLRLTDPPILVALPLLMAEHSSAHSM